MHKITVKALWFQPEVGLAGYYGAILADGTPIPYCSGEKWDHREGDDSLSIGWQDNMRVWDKPKATFQNVPEAGRRKDAPAVMARFGLVVPEMLRHLLKDGAYHG